MPKESRGRFGRGFTGLTKREHFAGMAMQGLLASNRFHTSDSSASKKAWRAADKLLAMQDRAYEDETGQTINYYR
jgi:hypothetical protein